MQQLAPPHFLFAFEPNGTSEPHFFPIQGFKTVRTVFDDGVARETLKDLPHHFITQLKERYEKYENENNINRSNEISSGQSSTSDTNKQNFTKNQQLRALPPNTSIRTSTPATNTAKNVPRMPILNNTTSSSANPRPATNLQKQLQAPKVNRSLKLLPPAASSTPNKRRESSPITGMPPAKKSSANLRNLDDLELSEDDDNDGSAEDDVFDDGFDEENGEVDAEHGDKDEDDTSTSASFKEFLIAEVKLCRSIWDSGINHIERSNQATVEWKEIFSNVQGNFNHIFFNKSGKTYNFKHKMTLFRTLDSLFVYSFFEFIF